MERLAAEKAAEVEPRAELEKRLEAIENEKRAAAEAAQREEEEKVKTKAAQIFVATKIQAMQRGHLARSYLARLQIFVVFLQAAWVAIKSEMCSRIEKA